jgi:alpha,alpha-trehalose phosphorylase
MALKNTHGTSLYPQHEWDITETHFDPAYNYRNESIFALGNGTIGMRGNFEEGFSGKNGLEGTYLNGFYESEAIRYPEPAYGYAEKSQTMLNVTNGKIIRLFVEGEAFDLQAGTILEYARVLRLDRGWLERRVVWRSPGGREVKIEIVRLVSFVRPSLAAIRYTVTPLNFSGTIRLVSVLNGDVKNLTTEADPRAGSGLSGRVLSVEDHVLEDEFGALKQRTQHTKFTLACAMQHTLTSEGKVQRDHHAESLALQISYTIQVIANQRVQLDKFIGYTTSRNIPEDQVLSTARSVVEDAARSGFATLQTEQTQFLAEFWENADVTIDGDAPLQQGLRFNMFHLLQSVGRDGKTNIAAKGLTGEGYEGHYFWDTEMYVMPFFQYNEPHISKALLSYRYSILEKARQRARQMSHPRGVLFPWRTIDGEECSTYFPAGTAQYHINADVAYAIKRYVTSTGDTHFLIEQGAEMLFETARFWVSLGAYIPHKGGKFCINTVTGPDEYTAIVNNNCFTNLMARENLAYAHEIAGWLKTESPTTYQQIAARIGIGEAEPGEWQAAADAMYVPYEAALGIYLQDDSFLDKAPWDFEHTPPENYPLLMHYHPLVIYRHQVCKQADLVLALFLLGHLFTPEEKQRNYDFYEKITTHDSSLSTCIFSIVASEIGDHAPSYREKAYRYFMNTARMDLDDFHGNVKDGVHIANMAGTWMCIAYGFGGMRIHSGALHLSPYLPAEWGSYRFKINYQGCVLSVAVARESVTYTLLKGAHLEFVHHGEKLQLTSESNTLQTPTFA